MELLHEGFAPQKSCSVTVIVCTRDRPELLEKCIQALFTQTYPDFDVLVVDNAPTGSAREVCGRWPATWIHARAPGLTRARNVGARAARGDLIAFIDDDGVPEPGWLEAMVQDFRDPGIAAVSGRVRYMNAVPGTRAMSDQESTEEFARPRNRFDLATRNWFALACFGGIGDGGNMMFRREVFSSGILFDERLGRGRILETGDEHVLFASMISAGYRIAHNPAAVVRHPCPATPSSQEARRFRDLRMSVAYVFFLWHEYPAHRADIARFLRRAVLKRLTAATGRASPALRLSPVRALEAVIGGPAAFRKAKLDWSAASLPRRQAPVATMSRVARPAPGSR